MVAAKAAAGHGFFVACDAAGRVIGQASYGQFRGGMGYRDLHGAFDPSCRMPGVAASGGALLQAVEDHARHGGAHQMIAGVSGENPDGRAFHDRMGYRVLAVVPEAGFKFGRFMDLVLMQKFL